MVETSYKECKNKEELYPTATYTHTISSQVRLKSMQGMGHSDEVKSKVISIEILKPNLP